jgi:AmmeMemoRadiSam system protein B
MRYNLDHGNLPMQEIPIALYHFFGTFGRFFVERPLATLDIKLGRNCWLALVFCWGLHLFCAGPAVSAEDRNNTFLGDVEDLAFVNGVLERERKQAPPQIAVTGITVPHHLLAADLIVRGILAASGGRYERVLVLSPDHFRSLETPFGITTADLESVTGRLVADRSFAQAVLSASPMFTDVGTAPREHGIHAVVPFIRSVFPDAHVVAITTATHSTPADWRTAVEVLGRLVDRETLIVQSTDYSHFLPVWKAALRDQETLTVLTSGDPESVLALRQPSHMDSKASQFIQMALQRGLYGATPIVIANRNAYEYVPTDGPTTSYVVTIFTTEPEKGGRLQYPDQTVTYFGGDTFIGRGWTPLAMRPAAVDWLTQQLEAFTAGNPLVINLEGVLLNERPAGTNNVQHLMLSQLALPVLQKLGVTAASLANNHAYDFGEEGLDQTASTLEGAGITVLRHGKITDLGSFSVLPLTFKRGYFFDHAAIHDVSHLESICDLPVSSPLIVFAHWGESYTSNFGPFETQALDRLARCGVSAVIGAHSHQASSKVEARSGGALQSVFSMGNLIFDQTGADISGSLVELRVFRQRTMALRIVPIPNFFEILKSTH